MGNIGLCDTSLFLFDPWQLTINPNYQNMPTPNDVLEILNKLGLYPSL